MKRVLSAVFLLIFTISYAQSSENCKMHKKLTKDYMKCLTGILKNKSSKVGLDTTNIKEKKTISDWFKKKK